MIAPDSAAHLRAERRFDLLSAALIGAVAVLASVLAVVQIDTGQNATRAQEQAASLAADLSARIETSGLVQEQELYLGQSGVALSMQGLARQIAALANKDDGANQVGAVEQAAAAKLSKALQATLATSDGEPLDAYSAGMIDATTAYLLKEVKEQNRQVDLASGYSSRDSEAILGLSFLALAGVLTGLGAVLREGRAGWFGLLTAVAMTGAAGVMAVLALI